jgi:hypothetical protein
VDVEGITPGPAGELLILTGDSLILTGDSLILTGIVLILIVNYLGNINHLEASRDS